MNTFKTIMCGLLVASLKLAFAQGGNDGSSIKPIPPESLALSKTANEAETRGRSLLKNNRIEEAIAAFREAIRIQGEAERRFGDFTSSGNYELAKALTASGRPEEALVAYKKVFRWDPKPKDLIWNGPPVVRMAMDYAILLAKRGKAEEAKAIYYLGLRKYNRNAGSSYEPYPFLVVFDPDPDMTVWEYSPERLIAAATMARLAADGGGGSKEDKSLIEEVRVMEPTWVFPVVYLGKSSWGAKRAELLSLAESLAKSGEEKAWVRSFRAHVANTTFSTQQEAIEHAARGNDLAEIGVARRKASTALNQAKLDLEQNHGKVAMDSSGGALAN